MSITDTIFKDIKILQRAALKSEAEFEGLIPTEFGPVEVVGGEWYFVSDTGQRLRAVTEKERTTIQASW